MRASMHLKEAKYALKTSKIKISAINIYYIIKNIVRFNK